LGGGIGQRSQGVKEHAFNRDDRYFSRAPRLSDRLRFDVRFDWRA
jgi:hypothetical protein